MNIQEFIKRITGISTPFGGISWEGTKQKSDVEVVIDEFVKEWRKNGFGNPANVNTLIGPEEHNLIKLTSQIYAKNLINGELDKTKYMPDIEWNEEEATNICYAQMTSGYILGRFINKRQFSREEFPSSTPKGFDDFSELCTRWFEGVLSIDWVNKLGDKFLINVSNLLGEVMLFDHLEDVEEYIKKNVPLLATMRLCFLIGVIMYRFLMSGAPKLTVEKA